MHGIFHHQLEEECAEAVFSDIFFIRKLTRSHVVSPDPNCARRISHVYKDIVTNLEVVDVTFAHIIGPALCACPRFARIFHKLLCRMQPFCVGASD